MSNTIENTAPNPHFLAEVKKELAFESGGIKYYQFADGGMPIYYTRLAAMQEKVSMAQEWKITSGVLDEFLGILEVYAGVRSGDSRIESLSAEQRLQEIATKISLLRKRIEIQDGVQLLYELASVWYFDETEDPAVYDYAHARKKIRHWLNDRELHAFFLRTPLTNFLPLAINTESGMETLRQNLYELQYIASIHNLSMLSEKEKEGELGRTIHLQAEVSLALKNLVDLGQKSTTTS